MTNSKDKPAVPATVSRYMRMLAYRAAVAIKGTEAARVRSAKGVAGRQRKRSERKPAAETAIKT